MAPVGRRVPLTLAAATQSGSLGRASDEGDRLPVDLLEDRPLSSPASPAGALIDSATETTVSVASGTSPHCRAADIERP